MAYLLLVIFVPVFGMFFYLSFGINFWKTRMYQRKMGENEFLHEEIKKKIDHYNKTTLKQINREDNPLGELAAMLIRDLQTPLTQSNSVKLLINGEEKFEEVLKAMDAAQDHIHIEYYIFEQDDIGTRIIDMMIKKAKEGVQVRFIYDDFGSPTIKKPLERKMREAGVEVYPFHKVHFYLLANRLYYRNHRKIIVIDGQTGFVGGINVSDKYINNGKHKLFWRDTHLRIDGPGVYYLQYLFFTDWKFCCGHLVDIGDKYFPEISPGGSNELVQMVSSGPDSIQPSIMFTMLQAIFLARNEILITTPYFIPGESVVNALRIAALSGLKVKLLVPGKSDSKLVNFASQAYYTTLIRAGVEVYLYQKGFVHAKTLVSDGKLSIVGSANMDNRSFELNFEVNAIVYDEGFSEKLRNTFFEDLKDSDKIDPEVWLNRGFLKRLPEKIARLLSPAL